ncbi:Transcriptional regulator, TetR family protein [Minicystis rosea]|nr:Transcriptional regulator, TetR family protein [Minicystis rosea]
MDETAKRPGRPRSEEARQAIHAAVLRIVQGGGYGALTMDGVAAEAGVGKQTLYRWWPSRAALMLEVLNGLASAHVPSPDTGTLRGDVGRFLTSTFALSSKVAAIPILLRGLMAEAQLDPAFGAELRKELIEPRRAALRALFDRAKARGELRPRCDVELCLDIAFGVLWYRLLAQHAPLTPVVAQKLADAIAREATEEG